MATDVDPTAVFIPPVICIMAAFSWLYRLCLLHITPHSSWACSWLMLMALLRVERFPKRTLASLEHLPLDIVFMLSADLSVKDLVRLMQVRHCTTHLFLWF
jgi:hypothetical protein